MFSYIGTLWAFWWMKQHTVLYCKLQSNTFSLFSEFVCGGPNIWTMDKFMWYWHLLWHIVHTISYVIKIVDQQHYKKKWLKFKAPTTTQRVQTACHFNNTGCDVSSGAGSSLSLFSTTACTSRNISRCFLIRRIIVWSSATPDQHKWVARTGKSL